MSKPTIEELKKGLQYLWDNEEVCCNDTLDDLGDALTELGELRDKETRFEAWKKEYYNLHLESKAKLEKAMSHLKHIHTSHHDIYSMGCQCSTCETLKQIEEE